MSRQSKTNDYAYAAGIIDGEGCIQIRKTAVKRIIDGFAYSLTILVNMCDGEALDFLFGKFGGSIYRTKNYEDGIKKLPVYRWEIRTKKAAEFLKRLVPFLRIKKAQAELAIRFQAHVKDYSQGISDNEREFREWAYQEMRKLKEIHNSSRAVVETECKHASNEAKLQSDSAGIKTAA